jgi:gamma-glutamylcyclotransferase (GGCT)/AIG2-like uncharacterized protein YtfP
MRGESRRHVLEGAEFLGACTTAPIYELVDIGPYPALVDPEHPDGFGDAVRGELYLVDAETLLECDRIEGHPNYYVRKPIALANGERAEAYLLPLRSVGYGSADRGVRIPSGDWRAHRRKKDGEDEIEDDEPEPEHGTIQPLTCDWGDCDHPATCLRYDAQELHDWLPCCAECARVEP